MEEHFFTMPSSSAGSGGVSDPHPQFGPWAGPPHGGDGAVVDVGAVVAESAQATIYLVSVRVFQVGLEFNVDVTATSPDKSPDDLLAEGMSQVPVENLPADGVLRFGVRLPDGTKVTTVNTPIAPVSKPDGPVLWMRGGPGFTISGSDITMSAALWLWPLPEPGPISFVAEWPVLGVRFAALELDGKALRSAAS
jgi:hypothetical protein